MKRKSVLYAWGLSYLALLALMLALCGMLGYRARAQLIQEYKSITQTLQERTSGELQAYFDDMATCAYEIANNYTITNFVMDPAPKKESYYNLTQIQETLRVYAMNGDKDVRRYLYMNNIQRALSQETIYEKEDLYKILSEKLDFSQEDFADLLEGSHFNELRVLHGDDGGTSVIMLSSIPLVRRTTRATLLQVLDQSELRHIVTSSSAVEGSTSVLLDEENRVICAIGEDALAEKLPQADLTAVKSSELRLGDETYWFQYQELPAEGWKLITVLPMTEIHARSQWIVRQSVPIIGAILLLGAALCGVFLYYNYRPLNSLRKHLTETGVPLAGNEYDQLAAAFSDARSSLEQMQVLWDDQTRRLRQEFLQSCLEGDVVYDEKRLRQMLEYLDAGFVGEWFCVALVDISASPDADGTQQEQQILTRLESELAAGVETCRADMLPQEGLLIALLNFQSEEAAVRGIREAQPVLSKVIEGGRFVFSKPSCNFENIHLAYLEVSEQYRAENDAACRQEAGIATAPLAAVPRFPAEQEELLLRYITAGNAAEAQEVIQLVLRYNWEEQILPVSVCRCLAYDILCGILRSVGALPAVWETQKDVLREDLHALRHYSEREEIAALLLKTVERTAAACAQWHSTAAAAKEQPLDRILQCVNEHYRETDFNVSKAADYLAMNVAYLSKLFKQQTGIGLLNYISGLRVKYAKQCILERHISVAQAAREAGFENINTFIRIFKKYEGITPGNLADGK